MKVLDLFSGIGGFSLGLERAGMETVAFCEYDEKCRQVLTKHWPDIPQYEDVRTLTGAQLERDGIRDVGLICGGFPCKQTSVAAAISGNRNGLDGKDSGLWREYLRLVQEIRPLWVIVENTPGVNKWACEIQDSLERVGYRVSKQERSARDCFAPHLRRRVFFIANLNGERLAWARCEESPQVADVSWPQPPRRIWRADKSGICRMDDGLSGRVDRIKQLGNSIMPRKAEAIGRAIMTTIPHVYEKADD